MSHEVTCSFCSLPATEVRKMIVADDDRKIAICNECVRIADMLMTLDKYGEGNFNLVNTHMKIVESE